ncbi:MAG TPA: efflux RND transporter periplasmic adaptor subunit [Rhodanobacteraceae bacterium]|jgi:RND family efflux transporter MFP subunit|nr:efflux RND transporter periplasmic adaptor subunit [Rhodanobacteraceae bacterium]
MPSDSLPPAAASSSTGHRRLRIAGVLAVIVAILIVVSGLVSRAAGTARLREWTDTQAIPTVALVAPTSAGDAGTLDLPGRLEAYSRASLYARVSGYLKNWNLDIGAPVKAGQLLAEIETPDLDQQLLQSKANLATAQANSTLAAITAKRWQSMLTTGAVSKQDVDEKVGDLDAKKAIVKASQADVDREQTLKGFARIVAPFDGIVTARNTDVGALINVGGTAGQELFVVSDTKKLRVYVSVPQNYVPSIPAGTKAKITVPDHPGKSYAATVESSSQAVNVSSGSTLMQLGVDNANGELLPGGFANVSLALPRDANALRIPASALLFDKNGLRVATLGEDNKVLLKKVTIARDLGSTIEIGSGLAADDRIIQSPPDGIADGDLARVAEPQKKDAQPVAQPSSKN